MNARAPRQAKYRFAVRALFVDVELIVPAAFLQFPPLQKSVIFLNHIRVFFFTGGNILGKKAKKRENHQKINHNLKDP